MRFQSRLSILIPFRGCYDISVDLDRIGCVYHGYHTTTSYWAAVTEISCYRDEYEFVV